MEASTSVCNCNSIVPEALDDSNYEVWSSCMEDYLSGQDLWEAIIEPEPEAAEETGESLSDSSMNKIKSWRKKNSLALHAIKLSCSPNFISKVVKFKSAKQAWDLLAAEGQSSTDSDSDSDDDTTEDEIDWDQFFKDVTGDWESIEKFIDCHPEVVSEKLYPEDRTLLHYLLADGHHINATSLINRITEDVLEIVDVDGCTPLAVGARRQFSGRLQILELMVAKHPNLPNVGTPKSLPVAVAASSGFKEAARYLYRVTDENILNPECGEECGQNGATLLVYCIQSKIFDIALNLVKKFPKILCQQDQVSERYPIQAFATTFCALFPSESGHKKSSQMKQWWPNFEEYILKYVHHFLGRYYKFSKGSNDEELIRSQALAFLELVCSHVSTLSIDLLIETVYGAMIEATIFGNNEFINEMLSAQPELIWAYKGSDGMFEHAVRNRRHKIFNLIYPSVERKDVLLAKSKKENYNILHLAAMVAPPHILDRTSGPALQVQTELQWFKEVWNEVNPLERERLNGDNLTPSQLFTKSHEKLIDAAEKSMKDTAQSSTVVGALIVTIMFAAAFTVPGGNNQDGYPLFANDVLFKIFIVCDALSLFSSATSVLIFLGILTSRYGEDDFLLLLPRKLMLGISTLFFSITTMMVTFCAALAIMLNGRLQFILPIVLLAFVPIILFLSSIFPLLSKIYKSTFGPSIFDKNTKLPSKKEYKKIMNSSSVTEDPNKKEGENITINSSGVAEKLPTIKKEEEIVNSSSVDQLV